MANTNSSTPRPGVQQPEPVHTTTHDNDATTDLPAYTLQDPAHEHPPAYTPQQQKSQAQRAYSLPTTLRNPALPAQRSYHNHNSSIRPSNNSPPLYNHPLSPSDTSRNQRYWHDLELQRQRQRSAAPPGWLKRTLLQIPRCPRAEMAIVMIGVVATVGLTVGAAIYHWVVEDGEGTEDGEGLW
ncbi:hypothetical protein Slin15195_G019140 [Septoria linicola]|uniref:Uncharacterized protein n=1 Tax=Septoria linicola TaxID=215465 RepID=A0A9Q9ALE3_9PEZI|nr:hypothetical protein Slin15195_G019140 [Septoria linicola]